MIIYLSKTIYCIYKEMLTIWNPTTMWYAVIMQCRPSFILSVIKTIVLDDIKVYFVVRVLNIF